jgi:hypothetical protein
MDVTAGCCVLKIPKETGSAYAKLGSSNKTKAKEKKLTTRSISNYSHIYSTLYRIMLFNGRIIFIS